MRTPKFDPNTEIAFKLTLGEFACKCCAQGAAHIRLLLAWERLRRQLDRAVTINSGFRCEVHNAAVGGAPGSQHTQGLAMDIKFDPQGLDLDALIGYFTHAGFRGIGRASGWWHLDVRSREKPEFWRYESNGSRVPDPEAKDAWMRSRGADPLP